MLAPRKRPLPLLAALTFILLVLFYHRIDADRFYTQWSSTDASLSHTLAANKTLGFGAVVVVSAPESPRLPPLLQAAAVTDINLTIPQQPIWTEGAVRRFRNSQDDGVTKGSILAWLGHLHALQWFLDSGLETALILEDDVDWDVQLRSLQIPLAANAARTLLPPAKRKSSPFRKSDDSHIHYWGNPESWDLLYLGHCGDYFNQVTYEGLVPTEKPFNLTDGPHVVYADPSLPDRDELHPFTQDLFNVLELPAHSRAFHRSRFPLCSFGYAVTRAAAERLLSDLAPPKLTEKGPRAFDVALLHACSKGSKTPSPTPHQNPKPHPDPKLRHKYASPGLRCWTVNSELFHHMPGASQIATIGTFEGEELGIPPVDLAGQTQIMDRLETTNIGCGFWTGAFSYEEDDKQRLEFLQETVGRQGKCWKQGRD